ncbi:MAG: peptidoglycan-binding protein [Deltaproteobacteria bacterium]|nr:peptidoglycan-binding protein [Deltaproteobacteria bacterium]
MTTKKAPMTPRDPVKAARDEVALRNTTDTIARHAAFADHLETTLERYLPKDNAALLQYRKATLDLATIAHGAAEPTAQEPRNYLTPSETKEIRDATTKVDSAHVETVKAYVAAMESSNEERSQPSPRADRSSETTATSAKTVADRFDPATRTNLTLDQIREHGQTVYSNGKRVALTDGGSGQAHTGEGVKQLQDLLHVPVTGTYDPKTKAAVEAFQKAQGLERDGKAGFFTVDKALTMASDEPWTEARLKTMYGDDYKKLGLQAEDSPKPKTTSEAQSKESKFDGITETACAIGADAVSEAQSTTVSKSAPEKRGYKTPQSKTRNTAQRANESDEYRMALGTRRTEDATKALAVMWDDPKSNVAKLAAAYGTLTDSGRKALEDGLQTGTKAIDRKIADLKRTGSDLGSAIEIARQGRRKEEANSAEINELATKVQNASSGWSLLADKKAMMEIILKQDPATLKRLDRQVGLHNLITTTFGGENAAGDLLHARVRAAESDD